MFDLDSYDSASIPKKEVKNVIEIDDIQIYVDFATHTQEEVLIVVGWIYDPASITKEFIYREFNSHKDDYDILSDISPLDEHARYLKVNRPDVSNVVGDSSGYHDHGFVLVVPNFKSNYNLLINTKQDFYIDLSLSVISDMSMTLKCLSECATVELFEALYMVLGEKHLLTSHVGSAILKDEPKLNKRSHCDKAILLNDGILCLNGWIADRSNKIKSIVIYVDGHVYDLGKNINRYPRPDLNDVFKNISGDALGFVASTLIDYIDTPKIDVEVNWLNGNSEISVVEVERINWQELNNYLKLHPRLYPYITNVLKKACVSKTNFFLKNKINDFYLQTFSSYVESYPVAVDDYNRVTAAIDKVYAVGNDGLLIFGWKFNEQNFPDDITVHDQYGNVVSIVKKILPQLREDVAQNYSARCPNLSNRCGFIAHVPMPTYIGEDRALCFKYENQGDVWMRLPIEKQLPPSVDLIKEILSMVPHPDRLNHYIFDMFENGLGFVLESINRERKKTPAVLKENVNVRQFGEPTESCNISIVIPLYGRCDFMKHQLARFSDDPDIKGSDVIYVVDDPDLIDATLELAARYHWLFDVPFRVLWYNKNLGYAGANNIGAKFARGEKLLLLNSDVIPKENNWLSLLESGLDSLPQAGAVGPLLQFGDDSIQHAGMQARYEPQLPGFLINTHPGMGQYWDKSDSPFEQPMLTAACLMLRTKHFLEYGGFDEGYVIGDFEDSDLCLGLRMLNLRLYVIPAAKLWHLERQSQTLGNVAGVRQLITLFNGWRYLKKIEQGVIKNPSYITIDIEEKS